MVCLSDGKAPLAVDRHKLLLPWANYKYYLMWGFPDHSAKVATVDTDKVSELSREIKVHLIYIVGEEGN